MAIIPQKLEVTKKSLTSVGFSEEEAEAQINSVGKIITMAILARLLKEKAEIKELTPANIADFLKKNFNAQYLKIVVEEESNKIVEEYLKVVTQGK